MVIVPFVVLIAIRVMLHIIVAAVAIIGRTAIWLARRGARRRSAAYVRSAAILATVADRLLEMFD